MSIDVKFKKVTPTATVPKAQTPGSAGFDLYADITTRLVIWPHETLLVPTGIAVAIPEGYFGAIYPRSGWATKRGIRLANCTGIIDRDFRASIVVALHNDSEKVWDINPQDRVAQIIFQPYPEVNLVEVEELDETERGTGGFGSTGN